MTQTGVVLDAVTHAVQNDLLRGAFEASTTGSLFSRTDRKSSTTGTTVPFEIRVPDRDASTLDGLVESSGAASRTELLVRSLRLYLQ